MNISIIASTSFEINSFREITACHAWGNSSHLQFLVTGVGMLAATYAIGKHIEQKRPDFMIQAGVAGSFREELPPGSLVLVSHDLVADTCVKESVGYRSLEELGLQPDVAPYRNGWLENRELPHWSLPGIPVVRGITVNEISTPGEKTDWFREKYQPATESMEGAALHFVAIQENIPFLQIRTISNRVGERNKEKWKLKEAIALLNQQLPLFIENIIAHGTHHRI